MHDITSIHDIETIQMALIQSFSTLAKEYNIDSALADRYIIMLIDTTKLLMGEYLRLFKEGKIAKDQEYKFDPKQIDTYNEILGEEL